MNSTGQTRSEGFLLRSDAAITAGDSLEELQIDHVPHSRIQADASGSEAELSHGPMTRRGALRKVGRYARYTAPVIVSLTLSTPAWASHDQGQQKSQT